MVPTAPSSVDNGGPVDSANLAEYHDMSVVSSWFKSFGNNALSFSGGLEYGYNDQFFLRGGYFYEGQTQGDRQYFTLGVGLKYNHRPQFFLYSFLQEVELRATLCKYDSLWTCI